MRKFSGPLAHMIKRHLELRRSLGFIMTGAEHTLGVFDKYMLKCYPKAKKVTRSMVIGYLKTILHLHSTSRSMEVSHIRQFCFFLFQFMPDTYIPESSLVPPGNGKIKPHIYTETEIYKLIQLAKQLTPPGSLRPHTYATVIGLLWVTGLRIGEIVRLNIEDVDLENRLIYVQRTKFCKSRVVPISKSSVIVLSDYKEKRRSFGHDNSNTAPFFVNERANRLIRILVGHTFRNLTKQLEIKTEQGGYPRLHDLRHTFATRWLNEFYQTGKDPTAYLPVLATYLGHVKVAYTERYLHISVQLLEKAGQKFKKYISTDRTLKSGGRL